MFIGPFAVRISEYKHRLPIPEFSGSHCIQISDQLKFSKHLSFRGLLPPDFLRAKFLDLIYKNFFLLFLLENSLATCGDVGVSCSAIRNGFRAELLEMGFMQHYQKWVSCSAIRNGFVQRY